MHPIVIEQALAETLKNVLIPYVKAGCIMNTLTLDTAESMMYIKANGFHLTE